MLKTAYFKYRKNDSDRIIDIKEAQRILLITLEKFHNFCQNKKIQYSLTYGSLIGAMRERNIIAWDDDIDLMMTSDNIAILNKNLTELSKYGLNFYHYNSTKNIYTNEIRVYIDGYYRFLSEGKKQFITPLCIDIFPFDKISVNDGKISENANVALKKIQKYKHYLIVKKSKYPSKSNMKYLLRKIKRLFLLIYPEKVLHRKIDSLINSLYKEGKEYKYFSPFANESFSNLYPKEYFESYIPANIGGVTSQSIKEFDSFLSSIYGEWKKPYDRSNGTVVKEKFLERK